MTDTNAVVEYMRRRDRLTRQKKNAAQFFVLCCLFPPFWLLLPIAAIVLFTRTRALTRLEKGKA